MRLKKVAAAAVAMVMAVSMLSVPAFAVETSGTTTKTDSAAKYEDVGEGVESNLDTTKGTASTKVNVIYSSSSAQLSVTVPISVTFAVWNDLSLITPSEGTYKIVNNSSVPVHVTSVEVTPAENAEYQLVSDVKNATGIDKAMQLTMKVGTQEIKLESNSDKSAKEQNPTAGQWDIAAKGETNSSLTATFSDGAVNKIDANWIKKDATTLFNITYTVKAGTHQTNNDNAQ